MSSRYSRRAGIWSVGALTLIFLLALAVTAGVARGQIVQGSQLDGSSALAATSEAAPTIASDQPDYAPGATVTLGGANWQGDTTVHIFVDDDAGKIWSHEADVNVAADGTISDSVDLPDEFVANYAVTATGNQTGRTATTSFTDAVPISNEFSQAQNGNPHTGIADWVGGVLNATHTTYKEGMSSPQRIVIDAGPADAPADAGGYRYFTFGVAFLHNQHYAYDFPTGSSPTNSTLWGQAKADAVYKALPWATGEPDPLGEAIGADAEAAATSLLAGGTVQHVSFPDTFTGAPAAFAGIVGAYEGAYGDRRLDLIHDGTITEASFSSAVLDGSLADSGTVFVLYTLKYKAGATAPDQMFLAFGGHIAIGYDGGTKTGGIADDWGIGMGGGAISGAPYHITMESWEPDGNVGSQDNQIMASAVIAPGVKWGYKFNDLDGDGARDANEPGLSGWTINVTGTTSSGAAVSKTTTTLADNPATPENEAGYYEFILDPGTYTVYESLQTGWNQTRPYTGMTPPTGETIVTAGNGTRGYQFTMDEAQDRAGNDFGNRRNQGRIIVTKVITPAGYPDSIADTDFPFSVTGPSGPWSFNLDLLASSAPSNSWDSGLINIGAYEVTELVPGGWDLVSIVTDDADGVVDLVNGKATLDLDPDETIRVTYTDSPPGGGLPDKSGTKFEDLDADGQPREAGEAGLANWTIFVDYDDDGQLDAGEPSGLTDANGEYSIAGITPGTYKVREVGQTGWNNSYPALGYYNETFTYYSHFTGNDFGNWAPATKSGTKFEDLDKDGMPREIGEPGLGGWTIFVDYDDDGQLDGNEPSAVTSSAAATLGEYTITGITPGTYKVREVAQTGWTNSYPALGYYNETFESRDQLTGNDFGNWTTATKSGVKFEDLDADGAAREGGEPGLSGWTIYVDYDDDGQLDGNEPSAVTGAGGAYTITGIVPGTYKVREVVQAGWINSFPALGYYSETFRSSDAKTGNDFGNYRNATKSGTKFEDLDADGQSREAGEPGLANWTIQAWQGAVKVAETTTDANGAYSLNLKPGSYTINEVQKAGWNQSFPGVGSQGTYEITLSSGEIDSGNDFGNYRNASKSGMKFEDLDADGSKDAGEPGLGGWTIEAVQSGNVVATTVTAADGSYSFSLQPGTYTFREVQQAGWTQSYPAAPGTYTETLDSGESSQGNDFGNWKPATKSGVKFEDLDADGAAREAGEPLLSGWTIFVDYDDDGQLDGNEPSDVTDASGAYTITGITPGTYKVREVLQNGWNNSYPAAGHYNETFESRDQLTGNDFGNWKPATKSGVKFEDLDADGAAREAGEPLLSGWTIFVDYDDDGQLDGNEPSDVTDASGAYTITGITPGTYKVREVLQNGWNNSYPAAGHYNETFESRDQLTGNDFGNWKPAQKSGVKFFDLDRDGQPREAGEPGLGGWTIYVDVNDNGSHDAGEPSAVTASDGTYTISGIEPGTYKVREVLIPFWTQSYPALGYHEDTFQSSDHLRGNDFGNWAYRARTPGYWKTHPEVWSGTQAPSYDPAVGYYTPATYLVKAVNGSVVHTSGVFTITAAYAGSGKKRATFANDSLLTALNYQGGSTLNGAAQVLFRAASAALLNATHTTTEPKTSYPYTDAQIVSMVNAALATEDRATIITLATELDGYNNVGEF